MRVSFLVYGVLYAVVEMVGHHLERVGWAEVSGLDVAMAVTDALLAVAVCAAVLLAVDLARKRWGPAARAWLAERAHPEAEIWDEPAEVRSWRPEPLAVPAERVAPRPQRTHDRNPYSFARHRFPKDPGTLL
ncbi:MAG TPA: hypothetical protein VGB58_07890 [Blastococcus sp.]